MKKERILKLTDEELKKRLDNLRTQKTVEEYGALLDEWYFRYCLKERAKEAKP